MSMTVFGRVAAALVCAAICTATTTAQDKPAGQKPAGDKPVAEKPAEKAKPAPVFVIAKDGDKMEVMTKEALDAKNKEMAAEHDKAMQKYETEKKAAEAAHKKFDGKEPQKHALGTAGGEFASKDAAEAALKKMHEEQKPKAKPAGGGEGKGGEAKGRGRR